MSTDETGSDHPTPGGHSEPGGHPAPNMDKNGLATAGFVLAVCAAAFSWLIVINFILWVLGLVFSAIGYSRAKAPGSTGRGLAIAGLAITLGGLVLIILVVAGAIAFVDG